ncbi:hypothetical protein ACFY0A_17750 [Streptomyces sp. NPDC001698]|uniref:hypothetical protein n=1 Tax=Streptomyces sp. NPDC001698 TaxID=3364601 RepID=UPI0036A470B9
MATTEDPALHAAYMRAHRRVVAQRGPAAAYPCEWCGIYADQWSAPHIMTGLADDSVIHVRAWSDDPSEYGALCLSCHSKYDRTPHNCGSTIECEAAMAPIRAAQRDRFSGDWRKRARKMSGPRKPQHRRSQVERVAGFLADYDGAGFVPFGSLVHSYYEYSAPLRMSAHLVWRHVERVLGPAVEESGREGWRL